jgi:3-methylcrotonyl-CoA carboxylase beta subunit
MSSYGRVPSTMLLRSLRLSLREPSKRPSTTKRSLQNRTIASFTHAQHARAISVIPTAVDKSSPDFKENAEDLGKVMAKYVELHNRISKGGPQKSRDKHIERGKMLARDRVTSLIDPGSPFLELSPLAAHEVYDEDVPSAGMITGVGTVEGVTCMIVANDATVKGGHTTRSRSRSTCERKRSLSRTNYHAYTWWIPEEQICLIKPMCFQTATTLAGYSTTKRE